MRTTTRGLAVTGAVGLTIATLVAGVALGAAVTAPPAALTEVQPVAAATTAPADTGLDAALVALAPDLAGGPGTDGAAVPAAAVNRLARLRGRSLVHAEIIVNRQGTLLTFQVDRGTIAAVGSGSLTVAEAGGRSATVTTSATTRVRKDRAKSSLASLATGDPVVVVSRVSGGAVTAILVVVPEPAGGTGGGAPTPTPGTQPQG